MPRAPSHVALSRQGSRCTRDSDSAVVGWADIRISSGSWGKADSSGTGVSTPRHSSATRAVGLWAAQASRPRTEKTHTGDGDPWCSQPLPRNGPRWDTLLWQGTASLSASFWACDSEEGGVAKITHCERTLEHVHAPRLGANPPCAHPQGAPPAPVLRNLKQAL